MKTGMGMVPTILLFVILMTVGNVWAKKPVKEPVVAADVTSPTQFEDIFNGAHELFLPPLPGDAVYIHPENQIYFVDWNSGEWPKELLSEAIGELKTLGGLMYPEYTFYVLLDYNNDLVIYNGESTPIFRRTVEYDPYFWALNYFGLSDVSELTLSQRELYHAAKVGAEIRVVPISFAESYLEEEVVIAEQELLADSMMMQSMSFPEVITNLQAGIEGLSNGAIELELRWPSGYEIERLEMFATTNLVTRGWQLVYTNIVTTASTNLIWVDSVASNLTTRFYALTDADRDLDFDGLVDGREWYLYGTDYSLPDTDGDGAEDGLEVDYGFDPCDPTDVHADTDNDGEADLAETIMGRDIHAPVVQDSGDTALLKVYCPAF